MPRDAGRVAIGEKNIALQILIGKLAKDIGFEHLFENSPFSAMAEVSFSLGGISRPMKNMLLSVSSVPLWLTASLLLASCSVQKDL
jgi:hypothetical protein